FGKGKNSLINLLYFIIIRLYRIFHLSLSTTSYTSCHLLYFIFFMLRNLLFHKSLNSLNLRGLIVS
ncbi:hypothetical protein BY458DRAFT_519004, partial [Sporodiniella umbellata]